MHKKRAVILIAHGSKRAESNEEFRVLVKKVKDESYSDGLSEKERQIISSLRKLPEDKQDIYFHRILADALEYETMTNPLGGSLSGIGGKSQKTS